MRPVKVLIVGDLHGNYEGLLNLLEDNRFDVVLQLGDLGLYTTEDVVDKKSYRHNKDEIIKFTRSFLDGTVKKLPCPVYFVRGNHDDYGNLDKLEAINLFNIDNRYISINDKVIAGFGGIHSSVKYEWNKKDLKGRAKRFYTEAELKKFIGDLKDIPVDILITHEGAKGFMSSRDQGKKPLRYMVDKINPKFYIHGHHHRKYETTNGYNVIGVGDFKKDNSSYKVLEI